MIIIEVLFSIAAEGAARNLPAHGSLVPTTILVDAGAHVRVIGLVGSLDDAPNAVRQKAREHRAVAVALVSEAWTAPARAGDATRARDRVDRAEVVRIEIYTPTSERAWEAPILREGTPRVGTFAVAGVTIAGPWARLLRRPS